MKKSEKQELVKKLAETFKAAKGIVVVDYQGLDTRDIETLRAGLREVGAKLMVVKNTLLGIALKEGKNIADDETVTKGLQGQSAVVVANEDEIAPLQAIAKVAKEKEKPTFKFGILDGGVKDAPYLLRLALLPARNVLYGQLVGTIGGPLYGLLGTLQGNLQSLVYVLQQSVIKKGGE